MPQNRVSDPVELARAFEYVQSERNLAQILQDSASIEEAAKALLRLRISEAQKARYIADPSLAKRMSDHWANPDGPFKHLKASLAQRFQAGKIAKHGSLSASARASAPKALATVAE